MRLTRNFTLQELSYSQTAARSGLKNDPPEELMPSLYRTAEGLERIRLLTQKPIIITSGYRSPAVNNAVGGSQTSQHCKGEAADIICPGYGSPYSLSILIAENMKDLLVDQVIYEFGNWVHVSFSAYPRAQALTIRSAQEGYVLGIVA